MYVILLWRSVHYNYYYYLLLLVPSRQPSLAFSFVYPWPCRGIPLLETGYVYSCVCEPTSERISPRTDLWLSQITRSLQQDNSTPWHVRTTLQQGAMLRADSSNRRALWQ